MVSNIEWVLAAVISSAVLGVFLGISRDAIMSTGNGVFIGVMVFGISMIGMLILFRIFKSESTPPSPRKKYSY